MASQARRSKRNISTVDSDTESTTPRSQLAKRGRQSQLQFGQTAITSASSLTTSTTTTTRSPSLFPDPEDLRVHPSEHALARRQRTIIAAQRAEFDVDWASIGADYRLRHRTHKSILRHRISWIYKHGLELHKKDILKGTWHPKCPKYWLCYPCWQVVKTQLMASNSTDSCSRHLMMIHEIEPPGTVATPSARASAAAIENYLEEELPLHAERWREDFINWIVHDDITFEQAASTRLRSVIINGGPKVRHLLPCARTVRTWVLNTYNERISEVIAALARSRSKINLSLDAWSSSNNQSLLGVCGHWINKHGQFITALLALRPLDSHDGTDIAQVLHGVISTFNLEAKLGAFQMDNADTNDTALRALCTLLPTEHRFDPSEARLRCFGHIVNLVVKALLFGEGTSRLQKELQDAGDKEAFAIWRKQGAIGHLHNIVTYIGTLTKAAEGV